MASSVLHNTGSSILNQNDDYSSAPQNNSQQKLKLQKNQINYQSSNEKSNTSLVRSVAKSLPPPTNVLGGTHQVMVNTSQDFSGSQINRKPSQQSDRMSIASGRGQPVFSENGQRMIARKEQPLSDVEGPPGFQHHSHRGDQQHMLDVSYHSTTQRSS